MVLQSSRRVFWLYGRVTLGRVIVTWRRRVVVIMLQKVQNMVALLVVWLVVQTVWFSYQLCFRKFSSSIGIIQDRKSRLDSVMFIMRLVVRARSGRGVSGFWFIISSMSLLVSSFISRMRSQVLVKTSRSRCSGVVVSFAVNVILGFIFLF